MMKVQDIQKEVDQLVDFENIEVLSRFLNHSGLRTSNLRIPYTPEQLRAHLRICAGVGTKWTNLTSEQEDALLKYTQLKLKIAWLKREKSPYYYRDAPDYLLDQTFRARNRFYTLLKPSNTNKENDNGRGKQDRTETRRAEGCQDTSIEGDLNFGQGGLIWLSDSK